MRFCLSTFVTACSLSMIAAGCAQGGGADDHDAGRFRFDAGREPDAGDLPGLDAGPIVDTDAGQPGTDGGRDAGGIRFDGGREEDAGPVGCTSPAECSDGLVCNGIERCNAGVCGPGTPPTCDDGIACTMNRCLEPTSGTTPTCDYVPVDSMCPGGQTCNAATGCASSCAESPCRLLSPQCGCAAGQGCYLSGSTRSCAAAGTAAEGGACTTVNSCQPGLICLNVSAEPAVPVNTCMRFCSTDAGCVGQGSLCLYTIDDGTGGSVPGVTVCSRSCNPITSAGCPSTASCQVFQETAGAMRNFTDCQGPAGTGGRDAACIDSTDCRRGFVCLDPDGFGNRCLRYCDEPGEEFPLGCDFDQACFGFTDPLLVGSTEYGVCDFWF